MKASGIGTTHIWIPTKVRKHIGPNIDQKNVRTKTQNTQPTCLHFRSLYSLNISQYQQTTAPKDQQKVRNTTKLTKESMMGNVYLPIIESGASLSEACNQFSKEMIDMFDRVALEKNIKTTNRPKYMWYNTFIRNQHKIVRKRKIWERYRQDHQWKG